MQGTTICDAGCGTGSLAIPLALRVGLRYAVHELGLQLCMQAASPDLSPTTHTQPWL